MELCEILFNSLYSAEKSLGNATDNINAQEAAFDALFDVVYNAGLITQYTAWKISKD